MQSLLVRHGQIEAEVRGGVNRQGANGGRRHIQRDAQHPHDQPHDGGGKKERQRHDHSTPYRGEAHLCEPPVTPAEQEAADQRGPQLGNEHIVHFSLPHIFIHLWVERDFVERAYLHVGKVSAGKGQDLLTEVPQFYTVIRPIGDGDSCSSRKIELTLYGRRKPTFDEQESGCHFVCRLRQRFFKRLTGNLMKSGQNRRRLPAPGHPLESRLQFPGPSQEVGIRELPPLDGLNEEVEKLKPDVTRSIEKPRLSFH